MLISRAKGSLDEAHWYRRASSATATYVMFYKCIAEVVVQNGALLGTYAGTACTLCLASTFSCLTKSLLDVDVPVNGILGGMTGSDGATAGF